MSKILRRELPILLVMILIATALVLTLNAQDEIYLPPERARVIVIFRMDDPQPHWKFEKLKRSIELFREENVPLTLGVIPKISEKYDIADSEEFRRYLRRIVLSRPDLFEVALHGLTHDRSTQTEHGASEFAGLPYEEQLRRITGGKEILKRAGFEVKAFIPPFNTYDENTIRACGDAGIRVFSAIYDEERGEIPGTVRVVDGVAVVHTSIGLVRDWEYLTMNDLPTLIEAFENVRTRRGVFVLMMHYYHFDKRTANLVRELIEYMKESGDVAFMKLGDFGEGYLNGTVRFDGEEWIIGGERSG